ncbi:N-6 DNA methylase [Gelidibacter maritimus]|uniref:N-6 DNA methylase n=1 Tax=Gelidibacter maritimus TaxID=2761487 RepID=A0A7W2M2D5_9FLAO|nr:N-6 DNA methylase [Gelidibacter maritimus]MBA6151443.1 N-6 DNA methylase [Gelidibacter maritimus]
MDSFENKFWNVLDSIRGYRDIGDLKELFISLVFLKFANDRFNISSFSQIEVPDAAKWSFLHTSLNNVDFRNLLWKAFHDLEKQNERLSNSFTVFYFERKFNKNPDSELVIKLFRAVSDFNITKDELKFSDVLENLVTHFASSVGRGVVDTTTPQTITQLLIELLNPEDGSVLDSTCGTGGFFQNINEKFPKGNFNFYGQENNSSILAIAKLRFAFNENDNIQFGKPTSTLTDDQFPDLKVDYVLMHPPFHPRVMDNDIPPNDPRFIFGLPKRNANLVWIQHAIFHLNSKGKAALLLSNNVLSVDGGEGEIRRNIIEADMVEAIITLPSQLLINTGAFTNIWVLNKNKSKKGKVLFIDASSLGHMTNRFQRALSNEDILQITSHFTANQQHNSNYVDKIGFSKLVSISEIAENDFLLSPGRYLDYEDLLEVDLNNTLALGDVLSYIRPARLTPDTTYLKLGIKDLSSSPDVYLLNADNLSVLEKNLNFNSLDNNVLLVSRVGNNLKPTFHASSNKKIAYVNMFAFKVDQTKVSIEYLVAELYKDYIKSQIDSFNMGSVTPIIRREDFLRVKMIIPASLEEQNEIVSREKALRFQSLAKDLGFEREIAKLKAAQTKDLGSKRHNIMQHLNNVKASADVLSKMMQLNNGVLRADEIIDPRRGITVEKRLLRLQESLETVIYYVDNITDEMIYGVAEILNPFKLLKGCKERGLQSEWYSVDLINENQSFEGNEPLINISKNDFEEIYNNILENAIKHGFADKSKSYIFRVSVAYIDDFLEINFENNGKPFPKGIVERYNVKGEKAGATAGTGIGLWKVAEIANHFDAKLEVFDEPTSDFPVGFKFKFTLQTR